MSQRSVWHLTGRKSQITHFITKRNRELDTRLTSRYSRSPAVNLKKCCCSKYWRKLVPNVDKYHVNHVMKTIANHEIYDIGSHCIEWQDLDVSFILFSHWKHEGGKSSDISITNHKVHFFFHSLLYQWLYFVIILL